MTTKAIDINESTIKKYVESIRPDNLEIRAQLDFGYSYDGKIFIIYETRPQCNDPKMIQQIEFVKIRHYKSRMEFILDASKWKMGTLRTISKINSFGKNHRNYKRG
jgi:hypothetical protein